MNLRPLVSAAALALVLGACTYEFIENSDEGGDGDQDSDTVTTTADTGSEGDADPNETGDGDGCGTECAPIVCGDNVADGTEECDTDDFRGRDCASFGLDKGTLACTDSCTVDTSMCS